MRQDVVKYMNGTFVDFEGKEHIVTLCALSQTPENIQDFSFVAGWECNGNMLKDSQDYTKIQRILTVGVSICSPKDTFNEEFGKKQAYYRAANDTKCSRYFCPDEGDITDEISEAALKKELTRICQNPGRWIKGYDSRLKKFKYMQDIMKKMSNLTSDERIAYELYKKGVDLVKCADLYKEAKRIKLEN